jgi:hypothetical protein
MGRRRGQGVKIKEGKELRINKNFQQIDLAFNFFFDRIISGEH